MRKSRRPISKAKMYGFNPYVDQLDEINRIVAESGTNEATVLRKLVDEALTARRRKLFDQQLEEPTSEPSASEKLKVIEKFLSGLARQIETSLQMQDLSLAVIQDTLAEARAGRNLIWKDKSQSLKQEGLIRQQITKCFDDDTNAAKDFAYGVAQEYYQEQRTKSLKSS